MTTHPPRVMVVGSGWRFTSGISYYTCRLANALGAAMPTDAVLMRQLLPTTLYPGRKRVGVPVNDLQYDDRVDVYDGVDWWWGRTMTGALGFTRSHRPEVLVLQWWTGAVLHSYLRLAREARAQGAVVIIEWHEVQDPAEVKVPGAARYVRRLMGRLLRQVDSHVVHSEFDRELLERAHGLAARGASVTVVPHGPYDHVRSGPQKPDPFTGPGPTGAPDGPFRLLFFGTIRHYKGLEDLVEAFGLLPDAVRSDMHLTIVGETWEGYDAPLSAVAASPARDQVTVVNRYVTDAEARSHFAAADAVVLPYRRSSSSGPLAMAKSAGLPVVVTAVGGLTEAVTGYGGAILTPPDDPAALADALCALPALRGRRFHDTASWDTTVDAYRRLIDELVAPERAVSVLVPATDGAS